MGNYDKFTAGLLFHSVVILLLIICLGAQLGLFTYGAWHLCLHIAGTFKVINDPNKYRNFGE